MQLVVLLLLLIVAYVSGDSCPPCDAADCANFECPASDLYLCTAGPAAKGCSPSPWQLTPSTCTSCCDFSSCALQCGSCDPSICTPPLPCSGAAPYLCLSGPDSGKCGESDTWSYDPSCKSCCNLDSCTTTTNTFAPEPNCPSSDCGKCSILSPYYCITGDAAGGCSPSPWTGIVSCTSSCDLSWCSSSSISPATPTQQPTGTTSSMQTTPSTIPTTTAPVTIPTTTIVPPVPPSPTPTNMCSKPICDVDPCPPVDPFLCLSGTATGGCSNQSWQGISGCDSWCDLAFCNLTPPPPSPTNEPNCPQTECSKKPQPCSLINPYLCLNGSAAGGCSHTPWSTSQGCSSFCDMSWCLPPAPTPHPPSPWDIVPPTDNCTYSSPPVMAPSSKATPWGGIDVDRFKCLAGVARDCCGYTPRFNWILSTCNTNATKRVSMACTHANANTSKLELYYMNAYQWNGSVWNLDPTSSISGINGSVANLSSLFIGGGLNQDWDLKYAPTTNNSGTNGVGPPGFMFVISAKQFSWSALFSLNQITLNRGPGGENYPDNCWSSSAGELDFIESPFWAGVTIPEDRLYLTITADAGRCFPVQKTIPRRLHAHCNTPYCCEMCACPQGYVCFGMQKDIGFQPMGCALKNFSTHNLPVGSIVFEVDSSNTTCGDYFGGVSGGAESTGYFKQLDTNGTGEVLYAAVVDGDGVMVYRWPAETDKEASGFWSGIGKFSSASTLTQVRPNSPIAPSPPCQHWSVPCAIFEPSCGDECTILEASGTFGLYQMAGSFAAEAARDGLNWWTLFDKTNQSLSLNTSGLAAFVNVPHFTPPLPFYCNVSCGDVICHSPSRCPMAAEYQCTSGDGRGGCNMDPRFWPLSAHCSSCCDVRLCIIPCASQCSETQCQTQHCSATSPWACTAGPDEGGCAADPNTWPDDPSCSACCDSRTC